MMNARMMRYAAAAAILAFGSAVEAQEAAPAGVEAATMPGEQGHADHGTHAAPAPANRPGPAGGGATDHGSMQGGMPPPDARDPHAYAEGYDFGPIPPPRMMAEHHAFGSLLADRLEGVRTDDDWFAVYDVLAWYGRDYNRVWLKAEGEVDDGRLEDAHTELLWGHAVAAYWDAQLGVRHDSGEGPNRTWLAFGVQGLAPYWFELDVTGYLGEEGRTALSVEAEYELLITQRLILQPRLEATFYGSEDAEREQGTGLSRVDAGLRLRYEFRREFAPYLGIERVARYGDTADFARAAGDDDKETHLVAGVRFWF